MNKPIVVLFILSMLLVDCKTTHTVFGNKLKPYTADELNSKILENNINFTTFSGKAKVDVASPGLSQSFSASIDVLKDSVIGLSLRLMGVEGVRVKITPDSIQIIDRLNQEYIPRNYAFIKDNFNIDIDFDELQQLIVGNPVFYDTTALTAGESDDKYVLFSQNAVYKNTVYIDGDFNILRMFIAELMAERTLTLSYSNYDKIQGQHFAFNRNIQVDAKETLVADIEFSRAEFDQPFGFTFTVNAKYKRID